jgi:hypothetical protein
LRFFLFLCESSRGVDWRLESDSDELVLSPELELELWRLR